MRLDNQPTQAPLYGLVLAGGQSSRMGQDKSSLQYFDKTQRQHLVDLLTPFCKEVWVSARAEQAQLWNDGLPYLIDDVNWSDKLKGPILGIYSAMLRFPEAAWLVVACDLPFVDARALGDLCAARDASQLATAYQSPEEGLPEPLIAIWEPAARMFIDQAIANGLRCPRKILMQAQAKLVVPYDAQVISNINYADEYEAAKNKLKPS